MFEQKLIIKKQNSLVYNLQIMSDLFHTYEQDFIKSIKEIDLKIKSLSTLSNHKKQLAFNDLKSDLTQSQRCIKFMQTQIATLSPQLKLDFLRKVRQYKKDFDQVRRALHKQQQDYVLQKNKDMLIGAELQENTIQNHKQQLIKEGQNLSDTTYKLKESVKMMHQTQDISHNIGVQLQDHTSRLIVNKSKLGLIRNELERSEKLVKRMFLRIRRNKFVFFSVLASIVLVGVIIMGVRFSSSNKN